LPLSVQIVIFAYIRNVHLPTIWNIYLRNNLPRNTVFPGVQHETTVQKGKIQGAYLVGKTWNIPAEAVLPKRKNARQREKTALLSILREQKKIATERWYLSQDADRPHL
jgi:hypothetical protein